MRFVQNILDSQIFQQTHSIKLAFRLIFKRGLNCNEVNPNTRAEFRMSPNVYRQKPYIYIAEKAYTAVVQEVFNASPSIKVLRLYVKEPGFSFKAGQWVDFQVPGIEEITGYSMTSPPCEAKEKGTLDLAVKEGKFPPTHWVHNTCKGGEEVQIRVGGDFYYDPKSNTPETSADLLLIGGGVGINPLFSILLEYCHLLKQSQTTDSDITPGKVHLLYSAKTEEELIFREEFDHMERYHSSITCQYFVTSGKSHDSKVKYHRIRTADVENSIRTLKRNHTLCYICGPSNMTDNMASLLSSLHVKDSYIRYEKWW